MSSSGPATAPKALPKVLTDAWQAALAAEQQAVFGYQLLGPRLGYNDQSLAQTMGSSHEVLRDAVGASMVTVSVTPVAPLPDYPSLYPVTSQGQARKLAIRLEDDCATAWRVLYATAAEIVPAASAAVMRTQAQQGLIAAATRATTWRLLAGVTPAVTAFPGID